MLNVKKYCFVRIIAGKACVSLGTIQNYSIMYLFKILLPMVLVISAISCNVQHKEISDNKNKSADSLMKEGYVTATVLVDNKRNEDCKYLIRLTDNRKLEAMNFPKAFKSNGTKIWIKYLPQKRMSRCVDAQAVEITDIKKREE